MGTWFWNVFEFLDVNSEATIYAMKKDNESSYENIYSGKLNEMPVCDLIKYLDYSIQKIRFVREKIQIYIKEEEE